MTTMNHYTSYKKCENFTVYLISTSVFFRVITMLLSYNGFVAYVLTEIERIPSGQIKIKLLIRCNFWQDVLVITC